MTKEHIELYQNLNTAFSKDELRHVCFILKIDYDNIPGTIKQTKIIGLIYYVYRRKELADLIKVCCELRPRVEWPHPSSVSFEANNNLLPTERVFASDFRVSIIIQEIQTILTTYLMRLKQNLNPKDIDGFLNARPLPNTPGRPAEWWERILDTGKGIRRGNITFLSKENMLTIRDLSNQLKTISQEVSQYTQLFLLVDKLFTQADQYSYMSDQKNNQKIFRYENLRDHIASIQNLITVLVEISSEQD